MRLEEVRNILQRFAKLVISDAKNNLKRGDKIVTSGGIIGTINKVADNRELTLEVADNVEIKIASGMVADLYAMPEVQKKEPPKEENKSKSGFSLFSRKK